ncbi:MAG: glucose-6-phosphate dehydrogenase [Acidobacteriota bacterium]|nr:glucose-6-phosphate dehydrogenase [Acidobacteriota bacterium]
MKIKTDAPFDMIVIGASGDLAQRKLLPALYFLHKHGDLSPTGRIIGVARHEWTQDEFLRTAEASCRKYLDQGDFSDDDWSSFARRLHYLALAATEPESYADLARLLAQDGEDAERRARIFYLATPPDLYGSISHAIAAAGLITSGARIVLEKPIGSDLDSAAAINASVGEVFPEDRIYRIDHYLGKETVQNLMALRFGNALFEPMWRSEHVDHVQITVAETLGVEGRGAYYDQSGALRDMVQNHLLQLLCLVAMEPPSRLAQDAIREEKIKVLRSLRPIEGEDLARKTVRGQYREGAIAGQSVVGYLEEPDTDPASGTETFVALKAEVDNWRWAGVPFYLRTGKRMGHRVSEIIIQFRRVPHLLFTDQANAIQDNRLVIRLQPDESIKLALMIKTPGAGMALRRVHLNLNMAETFEERPALAYERLLMDVIRGNATLFMHRTEVEEAWRWIDTILEGWEARGDRPRYYNAGTWGPPESIALVVRDERAWYEHLV